MPEFEPDDLVTIYTVTKSPESGENIPVVITWWYHPDPEDPDAQAGAADYRDLIRLTRMNEHLAHFLTEFPGGERTYLGLVGTRAQVHHHPLTLVLESRDEFPAQDPFPPLLGHALVHADYGMYVLVADPLPAPPTWDDLNAMISADPGGIGVARIGLRADDAARHHYGTLPPRQLPEELVERVLNEEDRGLSSALRFFFGIKRPGGPLI
jgi:hypothetical protein